MKTAIMKLPAVLARFAHDRSATAAMVFGLSAIPVIGLGGIGIDYFNGLAAKARLDAAADAAAIAAITTAQTYISTNSSRQTDPTLTSNAVAAGQAQAKKVFYANAGETYAAAGVQLTLPTVQRSGQTLTMTVSYTGATQAAFGGIFGVPKINLAGKSTSSLTMGSYLDFYLLLDVSGSMGLPTSTDGQAQLMAVNPDMKSNYPNGCQFACHFNGFQGYSKARSNNITLRVDSVAKAVQNLIQTANQTKTLQNQYRIGIYPFIVDVMQAAALSSDFTAATNVATQLGDVYLDTGLANAASKPMGSGGTHFENVLVDMKNKNYVQNFGNGASSAAPKPFLFIVTDGADNNQVYDGSNFNGSQPQRPNNFQYCQYAQSLGVTISILYIPYQPIRNPDHSFAGDEDGKVNNIIQYIPGDLQACASPGYFFTANSDADINSAMQAMFSQALQAARLTQ